MWFRGLFVPSFPFPFGVPVAQPRDGCVDQCDHTCIVTQPPRTIGSLRDYCATAATVSKYRLV